MNNIQLLYTILSNNEHVQQVYFDSDRKLSSGLIRIGEGGSKAIYIVENKELELYVNGKSIHDLVIILPNMDIDKNYSHWFPTENSSTIPMYKLEVDGAAELRDHGLITPNQTLFIIYIEDYNNDNKLIPINCYVSDNFSKLAKLEGEHIKDNSLFIIDKKNFGSGVMKNYIHLWDTYKFNFGIKNLKDQLELGQDHIDCWLSVLSEFINHDVRELYLLDYSIYGDAVNYVIQTKNGQHFFRFFGFDLSSKQGYSVIDPKTFKSADMFKSDDFIMYRYKCLKNLIEYILFSEFHFGCKTEVNSISEKYIEAVLKFMPENNKVEKIQFVQPLNDFIKKHRNNQLNKSIQHSIDNIKKMCEEHDKVIQQFKNDSESTKLRIQLMEEERIKTQQLRELEQAEQLENQQANTSILNYIYSSVISFFNLNYKWFNNYNY
jgi:hypothetical protein